jgi:hypothetical protein
MHRLLQNLPPPLEDVNPVHGSLIYEHKMHLMGGYQAYDFADGSLSWYNVLLYFWRRPFSKLMKATFLTTFVCAYNTTIL